MHMIPSGLRHRRARIAHALAERRDGCCRAAPDAEHRRVVAARQRGNRATMMPFREQQAMLGVLTLHNDSRHKPGFVSP